MSKMEQQLALRCRQHCTFFFNNEIRARAPIQLSCVMLKQWLLQPSVPCKQNGHELLDVKIQAEFNPVCNCNEMQNQYDVQTICQGPFAFLRNVSERISPHRYIVRLIFLFIVQFKIATIFLNSTYVFICENIGAWPN